MRISLLRRHGLALRLSAVAIGTPAPEVLEMMQSAAGRGVYEVILYAHAQLCIAIATFVGFGDKHTAFEHFGTYERWCDSGYVAIMSAVMCG